MKYWMDSFPLEPLLWDTSILEAPPFRGQSLVSENAHIIFVSIPSIERTPLSRGKGHLFWVQKPGCKLHTGDTNPKVTGLERGLTSLSTH